MKLVATILVAVFVVAAGTSFAFAECAGHNKAQLVKQDQEQNNEAQLVKQDQEQIPHSPLYQRGQSKTQR